jgi:tRNA G18 (ribose-2'-O)-methylase SpoU
MRHESRKHMLQRYQKERQRNCLAVPGTHPFVIVLDGLKPGFNIGKIFRSAEAFGAAAVHLVGIGPFDPSPAKGSFRKVPARFFERIDESLALLFADGYTCFLLAPGDGSSLAQTALPARSAFILGHEEFGPSCDCERFPALQPLTIPQSGGVQSLNVSVAAGIVMYEYIRQHPPAA